MGFANNFAEDKAKTTFHRILVEQVLPTFMEKDDALMLLEEHITNNILKVFHFPARALIVDGQAILPTKSRDTTRISSVDHIVQYFLRRPRKEEAAVPD